MTPILICARGGSKGIPKKNLSMLGPWSLLEWSIHLALLYTTPENIFLSSDSEDILSIGNFYGITTIRRPEEFATDSSPEELSWKHFINNYLDHDQLNAPLIILPPTSPFRSLELLDESISSICTQIPLIASAYLSSRSPWFNMVKNVSNNYYQVVIPDSGYFRRQDAPITFDLTTCFFTLIPSSFMKIKESRYELPFSIVKVDREQCLDIDEPYDLDRARMYWNHLGTDFEPSKRTNVMLTIEHIESLIANDEKKLKLYCASDCPQYRKALLYLMGYIRKS